MCNAQLTPDGVWGLISKAQEAIGYERLGPTLHAWDISGKCQAPKGVTIDGRPWRTFQHQVGLPGWKRGRLDVFGRVYASPWMHRVSLMLQVPCRRCETCRRFRQWLWSRRAMSEAKASNRIWMGTLTFNPQEVFLLRTRAELTARRRAVAWSELDEGAKFSRLQVEAGRYVTLWLKRLRKGGLRFRYVITCETHKSGAPHFHVIFHELADPITKRVLQASWPFGFTKFKLVPCGDENRAIRYVTKYVAKNGASRIRASIRYGVGGKRGSDEAWESVATLEGEYWKVLTRGPQEPYHKETRDMESGVSEARVPGPRASEASLIDDDDFLDHLRLVWPVQQDEQKKLADGPTRRAAKDAWHSKASETGMRV